MGYNDPGTNLWTMSITCSAKLKSRTKLWNKESRVGGSSPAGKIFSIFEKSCDTKPAEAAIDNYDLHILQDSNTLTQFAHNAYSITSKRNAVQFAHQSMFSPRQRTILKAIKQGLLRGAPNLSEKLISEKLIKKYLPPAPATAKRYRKRS